MIRGEKAQRSTLGSRQMDLPEVIREHALRFVPAKALYRFISVCRAWKSWISTPFFAHSQSTCFRSMSGIFAQLPNKPPSFISFDPMAYGVPDPTLQFLPEPIDLRCSSNGLLCCQGRGDEKSYYICNPTNKEWKRLPKPKADHGSHPALVLIFEPSPVDFMTNYKVVCAYPSTDLEDALKFDIYSSPNDAWTDSRDFIYVGDKVQPNTGMYVNGVVYWRLRGVYSQHVAFDISTERSWLVPSRLYSPITGFGVMDGKLCASTMWRKVVTVKVLVNNTRTGGTSPAERSWEVKHRILVNDTNADLGPEEDNTDRYSYSTVLLTTDPVIVFQNKKKLYYYDMKKRETKEFYTEYDSSCACVPYVNSLVNV